MEKKYSLQKGFSRAVYMTVQIQPDLLMAQEQGELKLQMTLKISQIRHP